MFELILVFIYFNFILGISVASPCFIVYQSGYCFFVNLSCCSLLSYRYFMIGSWFRLFTDVSNMLDDASTDNASISTPGTPSWRAGGESGYQPPYSAEKYISLLFQKMNACIFANNFNWGHVSHACRLWRTRDSPFRFVTKVKTMGWEKRSVYKNSCTTYKHAFLPVPWGGWVQRLISCVKEGNTRRRACSGGFHSRLGVWRIRLERGGDCR